MPSKKYDQILLKYFNEEIEKYCFMWRDGGQFSTEKYLYNQREKK